MAGGRLGMGLQQKVQKDQMGLRQKDQRYAVLFALISLSDTRVVSRLCQLLLLILPCRSDKLLWLLQSCSYVYHPEHFLQ